MNHLSTTEGERHQLKMEAVVSSTTICMLPGLSSRSSVAHQQGSRQPAPFNPGIAHWPPRVPTSAAPLPLRPPAGSHRLREESRSAGPPETWVAVPAALCSNVAGSRTHRLTTTELGPASPPQSQVKTLHCCLRRPPRYQQHLTGSSLIPQRDPSEPPSI
ncbi:unnamed protein product [Arctogadus glacialis]